MPPDPRAPDRVPEVAPFRRRLLRWFDAAKRDLPWRRTKDPWAVLLSEILLQQTTVAAVVPHYERLLARWPRPEDLAACSEQELLALWAGLGYYRRARLLAETARRITADGGALPDDAAGLRELPGVGEYTAAAVASIAHDEPVAAVDGNVERVITRVAALAGDPRSSAGRRAVRAAADALLAPRRPGDFNQAMMELGATVCRPRSPDCTCCPVRASCAARADGEPERYPELAPQKAMRDVIAVALLVARGRCVLMERRAQAPNAGFHELPQLALLPEPLTGEVPAADAAVLVQALGDRHGLHISVGDALPVHRHVITRSRICVHPFAGSLDSGRVRAPLGWVDPRRLDVPITTATRRILSRARADLLRAEEHR